MRFLTLLFVGILGCGNDGISPVDQAVSDAANDVTAEDVSRTDSSVADASFDADSGTQTLDVAIETETPRPLPESVFYVRVDGDDAEGRDGLTIQTAWATLGYACTRVEGPALLDVGAGTFQETQVIEPANNVHIRGADSEGPNRTLILAPVLLNNQDGDPENGEGYTLRAISREGLVIEDLAFGNNALDGAKAAIYFRRANQTRLLNLHVEGFNMAGIVVDRSKNVEVAGSTFIDTAERAGEGVTIALDGNSGAALGALTVIFGDEMNIHHNFIDSTNRVGIKGYQINKGSRIFANDIGGREFGIENPHKNDLGLNIFNNIIRQQISVPKNGEYSPGDWPYNVRIHDNYIEVPKGSIEGPRTHLLVDYNTFNSTASGRIYENHGGAAAGPMWMHHNVVLNARHGFFWAETRGNNNDNNQVFLGHNTVFFDDTLDNFLASLGGSGSGRFNDYIIVNNVFSAPQTRPGSLFPFRTPQPLVLSGNLFENVREDSIPADLRGQNQVGAPLLAAEDGSDRLRVPIEGSPAIDQGTPNLSAAFGREIGHPVVGTGPDSGAYELGSEQRLLPCEAQLGARVPAQVKCEESKISLSGEAGDWVTLQFDGIASGTYTLRVETSGQGAVEIWQSGNAVDDLVNWNLPVILSETPNVEWLGEVVTDGTLRLRLRRVGAGSATLSSVRLIPRFGP